MPRAFSIMTVNIVLLPFVLFCGPDRIGIVVALNSNPGLRLRLLDDQTRACAVDFGAAIAGQVFIFNSADCGLVVVSIKVSRLRGCCVAFPTRHPSALRVKSIQHDRSVCAVSLAGFVHDVTQDEISNLIPAEHLTVI